MSNYSISNLHGDEISVGYATHEIARGWAQKWADAHGETAHVHEDGIDACEAVEPALPEIVEISGYEPSTCCDVPGAVDADVELTWASGLVVTGSITLVPHSDRSREGRWVPYGDTADTWASSELVPLGPDVLYAIEGSVDDSRCADAVACQGHPAGPSDPMGRTVYCDGSCRR